MSSKRTERETEPDTPDPDIPNTDPAPVEENEDGEEVCTVCGLKGRPPGHH